MSKRRKVFSMLACLAVAAGSMFFLTPDGEPQYEGRTLSKWLEVAEPSGGYNRDAGFALRQIGTEALPELRRRIRFRPSGWRTLLIQWKNKLSPRFQNTSAARWLDCERDLTRQMVALRMLERLGPSAAAVVPDVEKLVADRVEILWCPTSYFALSTLKELGPTASPALANLLIKFNHAPCSIHRLKDINKINSSTFTSTPTQPSDYYDHDYRLEIIAGIREIGVGASVAIPALVEALKATNAQVVVASVGLLAEIKQRPELVVPALVDLSNHPAQSVQEPAVSAIRAFGK